MQHSYGNDFYEEFGQEEEPRVSMFRPKNLVGSIHAGTLDYYREVKAFDYDQVRPWVKEMASEVRESTKPDILGTKPPRWNASTSVDWMKPYSEQVSVTHKQFEIRTGLRDEMIPQFRPNKIYQGTETRNDYTGWNVSVEVNKRELDRKIAEETQKAQNRTSKNNLKHLENGYVKPIQSQTTLVHKMRSKKAEQIELKDKMREEYLYQNRTASKEAVAANVFKMVAQHELKQKQAELAVKITKDETFKPDISRTLKTRTQRLLSHDGAWVFSTITNSEAWSCCMNEVKDSPGCCVQIRDLDRWQLQSM